MRIHGRKAKEEDRKRQTETTLKKKGKILLRSVLLSISGN